MTVESPSVPYLKPDNPGPSLAPLIALPHLDYRPTIFVAIRISIQIYLEFLASMILKASESSASISNLKQIFVGTGYMVPQMNMENFIMVSTDKHLLHCHSFYHHSQYRRNKSQIIISSFILATDTVHHGSKIMLIRRF